MADEKKNIKESEKKSDDTVSPKGFPGWLKWTLISLAILISSLGAFSLTKYVLLPKYHKYRAEKQSAKTQAPQNEKTEMGWVYVIGDLTVNPLGTGGRRFVVAEYALESKNKEVIKEIESREPQLRDELIRYLRGHTDKQILDLSFQERSRLDLMTMINERLSSGEIDSLYYTKLILQ